MIREVGNVELCELLDMEPKAQCKAYLSYWDVGIVYRTCGHFLQDGTEENKKFVKYTPDLLSIRNYYIKKGRPPRAPLREEAERSRVLHREFAQEGMQEEEFLGYPRPVHPRREFRKNMTDVGRSEELCCEMDKLATEDHTHHITPDEVPVYRNNWWIRSNIVSSDTMPVRHRLAMFPLLQNTVTSTEHACRDHHLPAVSHTENAKEEGRCVVLGVANIIQRVQHPPRRLLWCHRISETGSRRRDVAACWSGPGRLARVEPSSKTREKITETNKSIQWELVSKEEKRHSSQKMEGRTELDLVQDEVDGAKRSLEESHFEAHAAQNKVIETAFRVAQAMEKMSQIMNLLEANLEPGGQ